MFVHPPNMYSTVASGVFKEEEDDRLDTLSFYVEAPPSNSPPRSTSVMRRKTQVCKVCGKVLSSASSYYVHMKSHSDTKPFQCTQCEVAFCRKPYLEVSKIKKCIDYI